jgi:hypothetical protein
MKIYTGLAISKCDLDKMKELGLGVMISAISQYYK